MKQCPICKEGELVIVRYTENEAIYACKSCKKEIPFSMEYSKMISKPDYTT